MKTKNMLWAALSMTAALVMTACTNDDNTVETPAAPQAEVKTIPYSVTVGQGGDAAATRATVDEDMMTLKFAAGDKLYVFDGSSVVKGVLTLKSGDEGKSSGATFEGSLSYTGDEPAADLELNAVLVGSKSKLSTITDDGLSAGTYPTTSYCDDVATAVEELACWNRDLRREVVHALAEHDLPQLRDYLRGWHQKRHHAHCRSEAKQYNDLLHRRRHYEDRRR